MRGKKKLHDPQARLGPHGGQHVRIFGDLIRDSLIRGPHSSIIAEIWTIVKSGQGCADCEHETLSGGPRSRPPRNRACYHRRVAGAKLLTRSNSFFLTSVIRS